MAKMIVNAPSGEQQIIEVGKGGEYFDMSLVIWDERRDGAIHSSVEIVPGQMIRDGNSIIKLDTVLPDHQKWLNEKPQPEPELDYAKMTLRQLVDLLKAKGLI